MDPALSVLIRREERRGDLLGQFDFLRGFIEENSCIGLEKMDDGNREIRSYPVQAALEAAGNAILQRDYRIEGAAIELDIYDDRLVLASPGFPLGCSGTFREEDLLSYAARTRNPLIARILSLCRLSEKDRLPFANTIECYKDAGCGKRPSWNVIDGSFSLVLPDLLYAGPGFLSLHRPLSFVPLLGRRKHDRAILSYCHGSPRRAVEIAKAIGLSRSAYFYNRILAPLARHGYLVYIGDGYLTNRDFVKEG